MKKLLLGLCAFLLLLGPAAAVDLPRGATVLRDVAYGNDAAQRFDVYLPAAPGAAPILLMVHGGAWRYGDKNAGSVVDNKIARWLPKGIILVSINYRMMPAAAPLVQAEDVARALAKVQQSAAGWGGDPDNIILMGHSAGAHLVALLNAAPEIAAALGAKPWKGVVSLDSGALNVPAIMKARHMRLYDKAFGNDPAKWQAASPFHRLHGATPPMLGICRLGSADSCPQTRAFAEKAGRLGGKVDIQSEAMTHREINSELGLPGPYTERVETFLREVGWKL